MNRISLAQANEIIANVLRKGRELKLKPLSVAVLDPGAHMIAFQREDNASNMRQDIAVGKASGSLALGMSSRKIAEMASERPVFVNSLGAIASHGIVPAAGGVIVVDHEGVILGAVGVTGDTSDNDEICAVAGIEAVRLIAQS